MTELLYRYIFYFFIYAFVGWCAEVAFAAVKHGKFVNRGFLNGPYCPIYGIGVCLVILSLTPIKSHPVLLYFAAVLLTSLLEFVTGFLLEKFFHTKWWDYTGMPLSIKGYVCIPFSLVWGFGCLFIVYVVHAGIEFCVTHIPHIVGWIIIGVVGAVFLTDLVITVKDLLKIKRSIALLDELEEKIRKISCTLGENISDVTLTAKEKGEKEAAEFREKLEFQKEKLEEQKEKSSKNAEALRARFSELCEKHRIMLKKPEFRAGRRLTSAFPNLKSAHLFDKIISKTKSEKPTDKET